MFYAKKKGVFTNASEVVRRVCVCVRQAFPFTNTAVWETAAAATAAAAVFSAAEAAKAFNTWQTLI